MERKGANILGIKSMNDVAEETKQYIQRRHDGTERSLKTSSDLINSTFMDGFD